MASKLFMVDKIDLSKMDLIRKTHSLTVIELSEEEYIKIINDKRFEVCNRITYPHSVLMLGKIKGYFAVAATSEYRMLQKDKLLVHELGFNSETNEHTVRYFLVSFSQEGWR